MDADDDTVRLTLNRPRLRNAFSAAMRDALVEALRPLAAPGDSRQVLLTGNGSAFCCGGDPAEFGTVADPVAAQRWRAHSVLPMVPAKCAAGKARNEDSRSGARRAGKWGIGSATVARCRFESGVRACNRS